MKRNRILDNINQMDKALYKSLSPIEVQKIAKRPIKVVKYSSLCSYKRIEDIFGQLDSILLLFETETNRGHWTCLKKTPTGHNSYKIYFFDSYGYVPDDELENTNYNFRKANNMDRPYLTKLLYETKIPIDYNPVRLQKMDSRIATCGRWCGLFLQDNKISNDNFAKIFTNTYKNEDWDKLIVKFTEPYL